MNVHAAALAQALQFDEQTSAFAEDVIGGLSQFPKRLSPKYFYDSVGSELFEQITVLPEYYPTRTELGILRSRGKEIAGIIPKGAALVEFGAGATTTHVARRIAAEHKNLTVVTHCFGVATVLAPNPTITVLIAPGAYLGAEGATVGAHTLRFLADFSADLAIVGASGLTPEGASDALIEPAAVYGAIVARAAETMLVADRSKFDRVFPARYASWREIGRLVCDGEPTGPLGDALARHDVEIVVA